MRSLATGRIFLFATLTSLLMGCADSPILPTPDTNQDTVVHEPSGIPFPFEVASFKRTVVDYGNDESLITADYFFVRSDSIVNMRVRVYPKTDRTLHEELEILKKIQMAVENDDESRFIATYDIPNAQGDKLYHGKRAFFRIRDEGFANVYLFEYGDWYIEYHTTFMRDLEWDAEAFVTKFSWLSEADTPDENSK